MKQFLHPTLFATILCTGLPAFAETAMLRSECRKEHSGGCSATRQVCHSVPSGTYLIEGSVGDGTVVNFWNKNPLCGSASLAGYVAIPVQGLPHPPSYPTQFCAQLHVESGSGIMDIGKVAFVDCRYSFRTFEYQPPN